MNNRAELAAFLDDPRIPLDTNAKRNGITRPVEYLKKFGRAVYKHCYEKRWTQNFEVKGVHPVTRGIRTWDLKALMEGFEVPLAAVELRGAAGIRDH